MHATSVEHMARLARLRELRVKAGMYQIELAERAGVARTTIIRLEAGDENASPGTIRKIARALRVNPRRLFE